MRQQAIVSACSVATVVLLLCSSGVAAPAIGADESFVLDSGGGSRDIQETIWFQGYLADDATGEPINATYTVAARIYDDPVAGVSLWGPESHVGTAITDGWFNIELGSQIGGLPAFDDPPYYLQLTVNGETMSPRLKMASVPSAFQSLGADNGLNLPYSGTWAGSGEAFSVTNTGPSICGYFRINNAGSSAGALYARHNGSGPAVLGWHEGTGSAIKGVANGTGYAGEFVGPATISDSLSVGGLLRAQGNVIVGDTLMVAEGIWFANNPVEGYVLRCADEWGNAEWGPPNIIATSKATSHDSFDGGAVVNQSGAQVSLTVPGPGYIFLDSQVWVYFSHTSGTADKLYLEHSTSPTGMSLPVQEQFFWEEPASTGTQTSLDRTFHVSNMYTVTTGGSYTYYLVGFMTDGAGAGDEFVYSQTRAVYHPYPIPIERAAEAGVPRSTGDAAPH